MTSLMLSSKLGFLMVTALTLAGQPSSKELPTRSISTYSSPDRAPVVRQLSSTPLLPRAPIMPSRGAAERPQVTTRLILRTTGSFGALTDADVTVFRNGQELASGSAHDVIEVAVGAPVELRVRFNSLIDRPIHTVRGVDLSGSNTSVREVAVEHATGLVRVEARVDGRRVAGRAEFHRIDDSGRVAATASGGVGATGESVEISAGRYEVRLPHRGERLTARVSVTPGAIRLVRLERRSV